MRVTKAVRIGGGLIWVLPFAVVCLLLLFPLSVAVGCGRFQHPAFHKVTVIAPLTEIVKAEVRTGQFFGHSRSVLNVAIDVKMFSAGLNIIKGRRIADIPFFRKFLCLTRRNWTRRRIVRFGVLQMCELFDVGIIQNLEINKIVGKPSGRSTKILNLHNKQLSLNWRETVGRQRLRTDRAAWNEPSTLNVNKNFRVIRCDLNAILGRPGLPLQYASLSSHMDALDADSSRLLFQSAERANRHDNADNPSNSQSDSTGQFDVISFTSSWDAHDPYSPLVLAAFDSAAMLIGGVLGGIFICVRRRGRRRLGYVFIGMDVLLCGIDSFLARWGWPWGTYQQDKCSNGQTYSHKPKVYPKNIY